MSEYVLVHTYLVAAIGRVFDRVRRDDRGITTAETIVMIGVAVLAAGVIAAVLWGKLRDGANNVNVPAPAAP